MVQYDKLIPYQEKYRDIDVAQRLHVTCELYHGTQIVAADPLMFDGILASAVVQEATSGRGLPDLFDDYYELPLPLAEVFTPESEQRPLWACSCLLPVEPIATDSAYRHRRAIDGQFVKGKKGRFNLNTATGRDMERRLAITTTVCTKLEAYCIGNAEEVERLLNGYITHIGKHRAAGFGEVKMWRVDVVDNGVGIGVTEIFVKNGKLTRPVPEWVKRSVMAEICPPEPPVIVAWTPPYGRCGATFGMGWRALTPVEAI